MRYNNFLLFMIPIIYISFQAYGQMESCGMASGGGWLSPDIGQGASNSTPDEGLEGMVHWLDQPVTTTATPGPVRECTTQSTTKITTTPSPEPASTTQSTTKITTTPSPEPTSTTQSTTKTTTTPSPEPTSTTQSTTTTTTTPGFEATFGLVGILVVAFIALRSRN
jgi:PGF-CTERM protein